MHVVMFGTDDQNLCLRLYVGGFKINKSHRLIVGGFHFLDKNELK